MNIVILFSILKLILSFDVVAYCGDEKIDNCIECGTGENKNSCKKCRDKYFLFMNNLLCIPCDDPIYGQIGCGGNCDGSRYNVTKFAFCNERQCKEGFYNLNGLCFNCAEGSPGCSQCYMEEIENDETVYKCEKCLANFKYSEKYGTCEKCSIDNCRKCHFNYNYSKTECDECYSGYFIDFDKKCKACKKKYLNYGYCYICSDNETDYSALNCYCSYNYLEINISNDYIFNYNEMCSYCDKGCSNCFLDENLKSVCLACQSGYLLLNDKKCIKCPKNCEKCKYDKNGELKCLECSYSNDLLINGQCNNCPSGCDICYFKENNEIGCSKCSHYYTFNQNRECLSCSSISEIGGKGCETCGYNNLTKRHECYSCRKENYDFEIKQYLDIYAYVNNTFQCLDSTNQTQKYLYGCLLAHHIKDDIYECFTCKIRFIPIINENICRMPRELNLSNYCLEAENIGNEINPKYSCQKCNSSYVKVLTLNGIYDCFPRENNLIYCLQGKEEENKNFTCNKCINNSHLNENNICECDFDSFGKYGLWCYKCDDEKYGNPGCKSSKGCNYYYPNDELDCNECKDSYFSYTKGQCFSCSKEIHDCNKCHIENSTQKLICDKCEENYELNILNNRCDYSCYIYSNIMPGCINCNKGKDNKCQYCLYNYFKTKNDSCILCEDEKYGGKFCSYCKYQIDENGSETEEIECKSCQDSYYFVNKNGKCYELYNAISLACTRYGFIKFENNEKLTCIECYEGYYLNSEGICINYLNNLKKISHCNKYQFHINYYIYEYDYQYGDIFR